MAIKTAHATFGQGDLRNIMFGGVISWSGGGGQIVYTGPTGISGFWISHIILRAPTGVQPTTVAISIGGVTVVAAQATAAITVAVPLIWVPTAAQAGVIGVAADTVTITPSGIAAGGVTVDVIGYEF